MSDDLLARATRALREEADDGAASPPVLETRHRVLATLRKKRADRVVWLRRVLPIAAVLVTSSAWAAANGHLGGTMHRVAASVGLADDVPPAQSPPESPRTPIAPVSVAQVSSAATPPAPVGEERAEPALAPASPAEQADAADADAAALAAPGDRGDAARAPVRADHGDAATSPKHGASGRPAPHPSAAPSVPSSAALRAAASADAALTEDPKAGAQALYTAAHQKHFGERDYAGALAAWETYLRAAPGGRFAAEAHYNRAMCLVRLGRASEARAALQAFADGGYGGYRQSEAKALLEALPSP